MKILILIQLRAMETKETNFFCQIIMGSPLNDNFPEGRSLKFGYLQLFPMTKSSVMQGSGVYLSSYSTEQVIIN